MVMILSLLALLAMLAGSIEVQEEFEPEKNSLLLINQPINLRQEWKLSFQVEKCPWTAVHICTPPFDIHVIVVSSSWSRADIFQDGQILST